MGKIVEDRIKKVIRWVMPLTLLLFGLSCHKAPGRIFTVGIATVAAHAPVKARLVEGFKNGMAELGYDEARNIRYIDIQIPAADKQLIDTSIRELIARDIDIVLTLESEVALQAKEIVKGTDMPVLFTTSIKTFENSLVESINHPGGNLTGVQFAYTNLKALEWLVGVVPGAKKIYLPYNPEDAGAAGELEGLEKTASDLSIELVFHPVHSVEEAVAAIEALPEDIDAVFRIPSPTLNERSIELSRAAIKKGIPTGAALILDEDVLVTLTCDFYQIGRQAARIAHQIHQGVKPSDIPVETSEVFLNINLRIAESLDIKIPDDVLTQASTIIR